MSWLRETSSLADAAEEAVLEVVAELQEEADSKEEEAAPTSEMFRDQAEGSIKADSEEVVTKYVVLVNKW